MFGLHVETPSELFWLIDNIASFAGQIAIVLMLTALGAALSRSPRIAAGFLVLALPFAGLVAEGATGDAPVGSCSGDAPRLRVVTINLLEGNRDGEAVEAFIAAADADVVATQETSAWWARRLDSLASEYPFRQRSRDTGETQLFSRRPLRPVPLADIAPSLPRATAATIDVGSQAVTVAAVHLRKPVTVADAAVRRRQMGEIAAAARRSPPLVVMGDFNASPTSLDLRALLDRSPLRGPALQWPPVSSWPSSVPAFGLQIDHVLATAPIQFERVVAGPNVGSNHLPLVADLALGDGQGCGG